MECAKLHTLLAVSFFILLLQQTNCMSTLSFQGTFKWQLYATFVWSIENKSSQEDTLPIHEILHSLAQCWLSWTDMAMPVSANKKASGSGAGAHKQAAFSNCLQFLYVFNSHLTCILWDVQHLLINPHFPVCAACTQTTASPQNTLAGNDENGDKEKRQRQNERERNTLTSTKTEKEVKREWGSEGVREWGSGE